MTTKHDYDVVIIGAGISGLVCGCYLAKAGLKTLIAEKNSKPGGYCTSFTRKEFHFDTCVHSLGSCREDGNITKILKDLKLDTKLDLKRCNPSDVIITPDYKISFWSDLHETIQDFQHAFSKEESNIKNFFSDLVNSNSVSLISLRRKTFADVLNHYFNNRQLKAILSLPILGNAGLPPSLISAFSAHKLYREFMIDGGYYPRGRMQVLPNTLAARFKELGGDLLLCSTVKKIIVENKKAKGIILKNNNFISSRYLISNSDAVQTFLNLLGKDVIGKKFLNRLSGMKPSLSIFILYLGIDKELKTLPKEGSNTWYLPFYDVEKMYLSATNRKASNLSEYMIHIYSERSMSIFINTKFEDREYWSNCERQLSEELIEKAEKIIPNLSKHIVYRQYATPYSLYKGSLNYKGAAYGWAAIPSQFAVSGLSHATCVENLYLTGHWTTLAQGVSGVAYLGSNTAKLILGKEGVK